MIPDDVADWVMKEPALQRPFLSAQRELETDDRASGHELVALGILYPIAVYIFRRIGLPWLSAFGQLNDAELARFRSFLRKKYGPYGFDPARLDSAADQLYKELSRISNPDEQKLWEKLSADALQKDIDSDDTGAV